MIKVGINGFGRIGRALFKLISDCEDMEVVRVNDVHPIDTMLHLLKYDSVHGIFSKEIKSVDGITCVMGDSKFLYTAESNLDKIDWADADIVIESTGRFKKREHLEKHLGGNVKKVVLSVPPEEDDIKMVVVGVNEHLLVSSDSVISNASCTTNSAAHLVNIMKKHFKVESCFITTIHSYTTDQNLQDAPHRDLRRARAAAQSIIPTSTGAAKALTKIFPELSHVIGGCGIRVPVPNGSLTDLTFCIKNAPSVKEINKLIKEAAETKLKGILQFTNAPLVSKDIIGNTHSCVFDSDLTSVVGDMVKLVGWYDNEMGYTSRLVDLIRYTDAL